MVSDSVHMMVDDMLAKSVHAAVGTVAATAGIDAVLHRKGVMLIGMPGCGKSTVSRVLARDFGLTMLDVDEWMAEHEGVATVGDIIRERGSEYALALEAGCLTEHDLRGLIVSPPGSVVYMSDAVRAKVKAETVVVFLDVDTHVLAARLAEDPHNLRGVIGLVEKGLDTLHAERLPLYEAWADVRVDAGDLGLRETVDAVLDAYESATGLDLA